MNRHLLSLQLISLNLLSLQLISLLLIGVVTGCQKNESSAPRSATKTNVSVTTPAEAAKEKALAAKQALFQKLSGRLMEVMSSEGPAAAIEICSQEAPAIAVAVGEEMGVKIGRTSLKLRNPDNAAPDWAQPLMREDATTPQFVSVDAATHGALLPILLQPQCVTCHGPRNELADEVRTKLAKLYPEDLATGFQAGDLRGWFWVEVSTPPERKAAAEG